MKALFAKLMVTVDYIVFSAIFIAIFEVAGVFIVKVVNEPYGRTGAVKILTMVMFCAAYYLGERNGVKYGKGEIKTWKERIVGKDDE